MYTYQLSLYIYSNDSKTAVSSILFIQLASNSFLDVESLLNTLDTLQTRLAKHRNVYKYDIFPVNRQRLCIYLDDEWKRVETQCERLQRGFQQHIHSSTIGQSLLLYQPNHILIDGRMNMLLKTSLQTLTLRFHTFSFIIKINA